MDPVLSSRLQFAVTTLFHMLWPLLSIGLSLMLVVMEAAWLRTGREAWYRHARFWGLVFLLTFGIGVASGLPLEFQFGTNWARFSASAGGFFGNVLAFEAAMAFMLEAAFLGIMAFGWKRVSRRMHFFSTVMVAFGASLSSFWIMAASAWMQTPAGVELRDGAIHVTDYAAAILNPNLVAAFTHMWVACVQTTAFFVAGLSAWFVLRDRHRAFFLSSFRLALAVAIVTSPLQVWLGDLSARDVYVHQPAKAAGMEAAWTTCPEGQGASWAVVAWPDESGTGAAMEVRVPYVLSLLATRRMTGEVPGLDAFAPQDRPPILLPFYAFRMMVVLGVLMLALAVWGGWQWCRGRLTTERAADHPVFWKAWVWAIPLGFLATEMGWIVREVGRQPWIVYNLLRTSDGVSNLDAGSAMGTLVLYTLIYAGLFVGFVVILRRIVRRGPDFESPIPAPPRRGRGREETRAAKGGDT